MVSSSFCPHKPEKQSTACTGKLWLRAFSLWRCLQSAAHLRASTSSVLVVELSMGHLQALQALCSCSSPRA